MTTLGKSGQAASLGKGEVESSILSRSTNNLLDITREYVQPSKRPLTEQAQNGVRRRPPPRLKSDTPPIYRAPTRHTERIAGLVEDGYRQGPFNKGLRCALFCGLLFRPRGGSIPESEAVAALLMQKQTRELSAMHNGLLRLFAPHGITEEFFRSEWEWWMTDDGGRIEAEVLRPDAWIVRSPRPGFLVTTAVEVISHNALSTEKRMVYDNFEDYAFAHSEFELEILGC